MTKPRITIVGLGLIGSSIGLALSQQERDFEIVGHDKAQAAATQAKKLKAVDKTEWNLISACDGAGLIILALPLTALRTTMEALAGQLSAGAVVMDTAAVKAPVQTWADELLPDVPFVGTNPVISVDPSGATARADLFEGRIWAICPSPTTAEGAVKIASDLAERLGAKPLYLDAAEHDGMTAAVEQLPALASMALLTSAVSQPTWREMRKLAGGQFESSTRLVSSGPARVQRRHAQQPGAGRALDRRLHRQHGHVARSDRGRRQRGCRPCLRRRCGRTRAVAARAQQGYLGREQ